MIEVKKKKRHLQKYINNVKKATAQLTNAIQELTLALSNDGYEYEASVTTDGELTFWKKGNEFDENYSLEDLM